ncbi:MAG TPA: sigma-70 family RNA polymerase sigma factor [Gemmataceae bacterium]|nr:sigma-70 family RNA polymerase sigma factor [Gemmataceae bacterium]
MKDNFSHPDERTPRNYWPARKGQPANPAKMPPSPLDPRYHPDRPGDASQPPPTKEELRKCLLAWLPTLEVYLTRQFPEYVVLDALDKALAVGLRAIYGDLHEKMKPEQMTSARWRAWLITAARNEALTILRRKRILPLSDEMLRPPASLTWMDLHEREIVLEAVRQLPSHLRDVIEAAYFDRLGVRAAGRKLGIRYDIVRRQHAHAIRLLRDIVAQLSRAFWEKNVARNGAKSSPVRLNSRENEGCDEYDAT